MELDTMEKPVETLEQKLNVIYAGKEYLCQELGTADALEIIEMYKSLEFQLVELYKEFENAIFIDADTIHFSSAKKIVVTKRR
jgi:hypothetical protein